MNQEKFWENRYANEGMIWGNNVCLATVRAGDVFKQNNVIEVLVPGCGTGRNSLFLSKLGFKVEGFDISKTAIELAWKNANEENIVINYWKDNILNLELDCNKKNKYDGILSINMLHLFDRKEREEIVARLSRLLKVGGILICTSMSINDSDYKVGKQVDEYTFESKPGRPVYYFTEYNMSNLLSKYFNIKVIEEISEYEKHGGLEHYHNMYYVVAVNKGENK